jgi:hypothetical protein
MSSRYPFGSTQPDRAVLFREVYRLSAMKHDPSVVLNLPLRQEIDRRIRALRQKLGEAEWGKS